MEKTVACFKLVSIEEAKVVAHSVGSKHLQLH